MNRANGQPEGNVFGYDRLVRVADKQAYGGRKGSAWGGTGAPTPALVASWIRSGCPIESKPEPLYESVKEWNAELAAGLSEEEEDEEEDEAELSEEDEDEEEEEAEDEDAALWRW